MADTAIAMGDAHAAVVEHRMLELELDFLAVTGAGVLLYCHILRPIHQRGSLRRECI